MINSIVTPEFIRICISFLSLTFGVLQYLKNRRTKKLIALEAVELHKNIAKVLGATQFARDALEVGKTPCFEIGRAEGLSQAILYESAKLYCNLKNTKVDDIDDMIDSGQLSNEYRDIYYSFSEKKHGWFGILIKKTSKLI